MSPPLAESPQRRTGLAPVRSVARALSIMEVLAAASDGMRLTEIAHRAEIGSSTCHRLLATLIELRYVTQDQTSGRYALAGRLRPTRAMVARAAHNASDCLRKCDSSVLHRDSSMLACRWGTAT